MELNAMVADFVSRRKLLWVRCFYTFNLWSSLPTSTIEVLDDEAVDMSALTATAHR
jgi:hypothetical protein